MIGNLDKMATELVGQKAHYKLVLGTEEHPINQYIGQKIRLSFLGEINCTNCGKVTKKSYGGGYCYPCTIKLPECDMCILKPELCHYKAGTCRDPKWGEEHCMIDHYVYLANSSGLKVGITRHTQIPTRFIDQGAVFALPILKVTTRYQSGVIEKLLSTELKDKTDWRKMLKGEVEDIDLEEKRDDVYEIFSSEFDKLESQLPDMKLDYLENQEIISIEYPVIQYPAKVSSLSFDKTPLIEGVLNGIKGQYLIFDIGVINIRSHTGYKISFEAI